MITLIGRSQRRLQQSKNASVFAITFIFATLRSLRAELTRVSDSDPNWIQIQLGQWIRIQIRIRNPDPDPYSESGSGSRSAKISCFEVLSVLFWELIFGHKNPGSGSVFSLKCWIRIHIKWIRIRNPGLINNLFSFVWQVKTNFNERSEEIRKHWGGGSLGNKSAAKVAKIEKAKAKELAQKIA